MCLVIGETYLNVLTENKGQFESNYDDPSVCGIYSEAFTWVIMIY